MTRMQEQLALLGVTSSWSPTSRSMPPASVAVHRAGRNFHAILMLMATILPGTCASAQDRSAIWRVVKDKCVASHIDTGRPAPCVVIGHDPRTKQGYSVLKDIKGPAHYLSIPTFKLPGMESPELLRASSANWFAIASSQRSLLDWAMVTPPPADRLALTINSRVGRGQEQLHIHISCIRADVDQILMSRLSDIPEDRFREPFEIDRARYRDMFMLERKFLGANIFRLVSY